jgi:hypothetical protein
VTLNETLGNALIVGFSLFLIRFIAFEAVFQHSKRTGSLSYFPVGIGLRVTFRLGGPFLILVAYKMAQQSLSRFDQITAILVAAMGIGCLLGEPGEIVASPAGLIQKSLLGLNKRTIPWSGATASHPRALRQVLVVGGDGTTITHSQYHVGQAEFLRELKEHRIHLQP